MHDTQPMREAIRQAKRPVALTGAGISAPSGVPTFQGSYKGRPLRSYLSRDYATQHPDAFWDLLCEMMQWSDAKPNAAHFALAALSVPVITQNIDGLHQKAGTERIIELHGSLQTLICRGCGLVVSAQERCKAHREGASRQAFCDRCGQRLDTDVVLYGDDVRGLSEAATLVRDCDLLVVIGTSLETYPAAALPDLARQHGARVMIENDDCIAALGNHEGENA